MRPRERWLPVLLGLGKPSNVAALGISGVFTSTARSARQRDVSGMVAFTNGSAGQATWIAPPYLPQPIPGACAPRAGGLSSTAVRRGDEGVLSGAGGAAGRR